MQKYSCSSFFLFFYFGAFFICTCSEDGAITEQRLKVPLHYHSISCYSYPSFQCTIIHMHIQRAVDNLRVWSKAPLGGVASFICAVCWLLLGIKKKKKGGRGRTKVIRWQMDASRFHGAESRAANNHFVFRLLPPTPTHPHPPYSIASFIPLLCATVLKVDSAKESWSCIFNDSGGWIPCCCRQKLQSSGRFDWARLKKNSFLET